MRAVEKEGLSLADLPIGVLLSAALLLASSLAGLALMGWTCLQMAIPQPGDGPHDSGIWTWLFVLFLGSFLAFAMWTAVGLFGLVPRSRRSMLHLAQSLISVGLTSGAVCLYLAVREEVSEMRTASIILFLIAALGSVWKVYFRIPHVVRLFGDDS